MQLNQYDIPMEKTAQVVNLLKDKNIDALLIMSRDNTDGNLPFITGNRSEKTCAAFIDANNAHLAIVHESEKHLFEGSPLFKTNIVSYSEDILPVLKEEFAKRNISKLALNISVDENLCDGLTQGLYETLKLAVGEEKLSEIETSSEPILMEIRSQKSDTEILCLRESVKYTQMIYADVFSSIKCGMTEIEIADLFIDGLKRYNVVNGIGGDYDYPIVCLVRAGLAHRGPGETKSIPGDILICDFSVRYCGYVSDIARTAYFLKEGETKAPADVQHAFETAHNAITKAIEVIGTSLRGCDVDLAARTVIEQGGYPTVRHSVGHQIGLECHETGTRLSPERPQSITYIRTRETYAIEPTVIQDGGLPCMLVEEDVVIREHGAELLSVRQDELVLIG